MLLSLCRCISGGVPSVGCSGYADFQELEDGRLVFVESNKLAARRPFASLRGRPGVADRPLLRIRIHAIRAAPVDAYRRGFVIFLFPRQVRYHEFDRFTLAQLMRQWEPIGVSDDLAERSRIFPPQPQNLASARLLARPPGF